MKRTILIMIAISAIIAGCQKYEEGPCISFRSAKNRLYGDYTLTKYTIDGVDSLQTMKIRWGLNFSFSHRKETKEDILSITGSAHALFMIFKLFDHNRYVRFKYGSRLLIGEIPPAQEVDFLILKLYNNDIHFRTTFNNKEYYFELIR